MNPAITPYHRVNILIRTTRTNAIEISTPWALSIPTKLPSATPNPPGMNDAAPKISDEAEMDTTEK